MPAATRLQIVVALCPLLATACDDGGDDRPSGHGATDGQSDASGDDDASNEPDGDGGDATGADDTHADDGDEGGPDDGGNPDGDDDTGGAAGDDVEPLIAALCTWEFSCCSDGELDYRLGPFTADAADCTERFVQQLHSNDTELQSPAPGLLSVLGYAVDLQFSAPNPDAIAQCAQALTDRPCNAPAGESPVCTPTGDPTEDPCRLDNLFTGTRPVGATCNPGLAAFADVECVPGSVCQPLLEQWQCVDKGLADEFCRGDDTCNPGLYCDVGDGRCHARAPEGGACAFADSLQPDPGTETVHCLEHLSCDPVGETCVAPCNDRYDCSADSACPLGSSCIPQDFDGTDYTHCSARGDAGGRCDTHHDCSDGLHCLQGACTANLGLDASCEFAEQCQPGLYCQNTCRTVRPVGDNCTADAQCDPETSIGCITSSDGRLCRAAPIANGERCSKTENDGGNWCHSGVCEAVADDGFVLAVCHPGAQLGEPCDEATNTQDVHLCAPELYCDEGSCAAKLGPGQDCGDDAGPQCLSGSCGSAWDGAYCTDAPSALDSDVVTCDGI